MMDGIDPYSPMNMNLNLHGMQPQEQTFLTPDTVKQYANAVASNPELEDWQKRIAMLRALGAKEAPHHTTAAGGFWGAMGQGVDAWREKDLQGQIDSQMAQNRPALASAFANDPRVQRLLMQKAMSQGGNDVPGSGGPTEY